MYNMEISPVSTSLNCWKKIRKMVVFHNFIIYWIAFTIAKIALLTGTIIKWYKQDHYEKWLLIG